MAELSDWGISASDNDVASPDGAQSDWVGADVGPWARETMAAVARWYGEPAWVNPTKNGLDPVGNKTIARTADTQIQVTAPSNWGSSTTEKFKEGRLIRIRQTTGKWHYAFITGASVSTTTLTLDLNLIGTAALTGGWAFDDNAIEFYSPQVEITTNEAVQPLSPLALGGVGTSTERDAYVPDVTNAPVGLLWINTTDSLVQVVKGSSGSRAWQSVAPLASVWSDAGGKQTLTSTTNARSTLNSASGQDSELRLQEAATDRSRLFYDASANETVLEGGDWAAGTAGRVYVKDSDGKVYYKPTSGGTPGTELNLTPKEMFSNPIGSIRFRTGAGSQTAITHTNHTLVHSGTLPAELQTLFEDSAYDEIELDIVAALETEFSGATANSVTMGVNIWFGEDYDVTPPADLNSGYTARFTYYQNGEDPFIAHYSQNSPYGPLFQPGDIQPAFRIPIYSSTLPATVNSFAIAVRRDDGTSSLDFTWLANSGDIYSSFSVARAYRTVS